MSEERWRETYERVRPDVVHAYAERPVDQKRLRALLSEADEMHEFDAAGVYAAILDVWQAGDRETFRAARTASNRLDKLVRRVRLLDPDDFVDYATEVFRHTGYLKDFKALKRLVRRVDRDDVYDAVDDVIRRELPDVWILRALKRGDVEAAVECWYETEDHSRARQCAEELIEAVGDRVDILVSARLSQVNYWIGRGGRRRYRRACNLLHRLRRELELLGEVSYWPIAIEDVHNQHGHRPALVDEMEKAGLIEPK